MIYEEYSLLSGPYQKHIHVDSSWNQHLAKVIALTQVNHQVRQESLPIVYRNSTLKVWTFSPEDRETARRWSEKTATSDVLANIIKYSFDPLCRCWGSVEINLTRLEGLMTEVEHEECSDLNGKSCALVDGLVVQTEAKLQKLKVAKNERCVMTLEMMQSLMRSFCELSKEWERQNASRKM
jgi:hypothetical protein